MHRIFLTVSDLVILTGTGTRNCQKTMQRLKDSLGKKRFQHITIKEYCNYEAINYNEVCEALHLRENNV